MGLSRLCSADLTRTVLFSVPEHLPPATRIFLTMKLLYRLAATTASVCAILSATSCSSPDSARPPDFIIQLKAVQQEVGADHCSQTDSDAATSITTTVWPTDRDVSAWLSDQANEVNIVTYTIATYTDDEGEHGLDLCSVGATFATSDSESAAKADAFFQNNLRFDIDSDTFMGSVANQDNAAAAEQRWSDRVGCASSAQLTFEDTVGMHVVLVHGPGQFGVSAQACKITEETSA